MKQLIIPEQLDIDLGSYGPSCESFIDTIKSFFAKKDPAKERVDALKKDSWNIFRTLKDELEGDLKRTYDNPSWVQKNLINNSGFITIKALAIANLNGKALTKPEEIVKVAHGMLSALKDIAAQEKPFIDFRRKLVDKIDKMTDPKEVDKIWEENAQQLSATPADRLRKKYKKGFPALGYSTSPEGPSWPVSYKEVRGRVRGDWFGGDTQTKTDGKIEAPSAANAKNFADAIRALTQVCAEADKISDETYISYWDGIQVEYDDLKYGDEIFTYLYSSQGGREVSDLATDVKYDVGHTIAGLYIAMFDKHMPMPANEGLVGDAVDFLFKKKKDKAAANSQEGAEKTVKQLEAAAKKVHEFHEHPEAFKLTGRAVPVGAHLHLAVNGKPPVVHSLPMALDKTFKSALELSKKFKKDMNDHARIAKPLMEKFEKDMLAVMERDGTVPQEALDAAMLPIIAAKPSLERTYFNSFGKDQHLAADWVGGNPFLMVEHKRPDGTTGWVEESYDVTNPCVAVDKADKVETLTAMTKEILAFTEDKGWWLKLNGPFDTDAGDAKILDYEFDRPVRHLHDMMSDEQVAAIYTLYSYESNTQSLFYTLCSHIEKVHESVLMYVDWSIEKN